MQLEFGVPLEDIFSDDQIHPAIKNLFAQALQSLVGCRYTIQEVITNLQGSMRKRLELKQHLLLGKDLSSLQPSPGSYLWLIRHFLGLLPIPLLPNYTDGKTYAWLDLSRECRRCIKTFYSKDRDLSDPLNLHIAKEVLLLPTANILMVCLLFDLLRTLCVLPIGKTKDFRTKISWLTKYFHQAVFARPYRPGHLSNEDSLYYPLMLYLVLKWPEIKHLCAKHSNLRLDGLAEALKKKPVTCNFKCPIHCNQDLRERSARTNRVEVTNTYVPFTTEFGQQCVVEANESGKEPALKSSSSLSSSLAETPLPAYEEPKCSNPLDTENDVPEVSKDVLLEKVSAIGWTYSCPPIKDPNRSSTLSTNACPDDEPVNPDEVQEEFFKNYKTTRKSWQGIGKNCLKLVGSKKFLRKNEKAIKYMKLGQVDLI